MTTQAGVECLFGGEVRKCADGVFPAARGYMVTGRTVTTLTSGFFGRFFAGRDRFKVWVFVKIQPDIRVARFANFAPDILVGRFR